MFSKGRQEWRALASALLLSAACYGALVRVEEQRRGEVGSGRTFGEAGAYEYVAGRVWFSIDPNLPANRIVRDVQFAPRDAEGRVVFSADLYILRPRDHRKANGTVLFEAVNRGNRMVFHTFRSSDPAAGASHGDYFLLERGFTLVWLGWQSDLPDRPDLLRLHAPIARNGGRSFTGRLRAEYVPSRRVLSFPLGDTGMVPYPVLDPQDPGIQLVVRDRVSEPRVTIPRAKWRFARDESGMPVPDPRHVFMADGFEPGRIYEVVYPSRDPVVAGLGMAAIRDLISHLKYGSAAGRPLVRAIGFGRSQSGRLLRVFLYDGFNRDEKDRRVFDGVIAHVAGGGRGSFNQRFAQPSRGTNGYINVLYPTDVFPFTDAVQTDPVTEFTDGILARAEKAGVAPKIFYTNSSAEYYGRAGSLIHTTPDGHSDVPPAKNTRIYVFAGSQHGPAAFPPRAEGTTQNLSNPNDYHWSMRALLVAMHRWLAEGIEPPASQYPRIATGELVPLDRLRFPKIPGISLPARLYQPLRLDFGPDFRDRGIAAIEPPRTGPAFTTLAPQVDDDGNETSGILMPEIRVPLATYTGWNLRDPSIGAPGELQPTVGSYIPFTRTKAARLERGDSRPSIEERYAGRRQYLERLMVAARELARQGYLLEQDLPSIMADGATRWDHAAGEATTASQPGFVTTSDGVRLHYIEAGSGPAILFVPGWMMPASIWEAQIAHFASRHRVVAMDPRSQGESAQAAEGNYPERRARDIKDVVDRLKLDPVVLVAWSMGVPEALSYIDQFGTAALRSLVLVDSLIGADPSVERAAANAEFLRNMQRDRWAFTEKFVRSMFRKPHPEEYYYRIIAASLKTPTNTAVTLVVNRQQGDWRPVLSKVNIPLLYVGRVAQAQDDLLRRQAPHARVEHLPGTGHAVFGDEPGKFNAVLEKFLAEK